MPDHACQPSDWAEVYYGYQCRVCGAFVAHGCEPWAPDDDEVEDMVREAMRDRKEQGDA